jgi:hypothetical protein
MKRIVIISSYPSGQREIDILNKCIDGYKQMGWDIMVVSHLPLDRDTSSKVQYTIYDSNNTFLPAHYTPFWWFDGIDFKIEIYNAGHTLPICRNMRASIGLAQAMGYEDFIFTECDIILSEDDSIRLVALMDNMHNMDKKMLFFRPEEYRDCDGSYVYETLMFGGNAKFFLDTFQPPLDVHEWLRIPMGYTLELSFYERFSKYEDQFLLVHDHSSNTFTDSDVNVLRYGLFNCELLYNDVVPEEPVLFIMNSLILEEWKHIDVYKNNELTQTQILGKGHYWFNSYKLDGEEIRVEVYDIDKKYLFLSKKFILTKENLPLFKEKGIIKLK